MFLIAQITRVNNHVGCGFLLRALALFFVPSILAERIILIDVSSRFRVGREIRFALVMPLFFGVVEQPRGVVLHG